MKEAVSNANTVAVKKTTLTLLVALCVLLAVGTGIGAYQIYHTRQLQQTYGELDVLAKVVDEVYYTQVDTDAALDGAKKGYVAGLGDPYSQYMTNEEYGSYQTNEAGQMIGIGVTVMWDESGALLVESVTEDSPASEAGIQAADQIVAVDGEAVAELGYEQAVAHVRGEEDTSVVLTIQRGEETLELSVLRKSMDVVTATGQMLAGQVGYIRISAFRENTPAQFQAIFDQLVDDGAVGFVFDLRDNGGGLVSSLEQILDPLLPEGEIAIATYRDGSSKVLVESQVGACDLPMVVLVNENTASAAELFAASLHDFEKATLVGTTTYGKGIMQVTQQLADGGAVTLTTATYQTTRGECYHGVGITPDEVVAPGDTPIDYDSPDPETDPQLARALELL